MPDRKIDSAWLSRHCGPPDRMTDRQAFDLVVGMGGDLARWWLRPEILRKAADHALAQNLLQAAQTRHWLCPPRGVPARGACWVLAKNEQPDRWPAMRSAVALPLRWEPGADDDPRLPRGLRRLAEISRGYVADGSLSPRNTGRVWGLRLALANRVDLSECPATWDSAAAALILSLMVAQADGRSEPTVWASAAFDRASGMLPVAGIEEKLRAAADFGAKTFLVAQADLAAANEISQSLRLGLEIEGIAPDGAAWKMPFNLCRRRFQVKPGAEDPAEERVGWFLSLDFKASQTYYLESLLEDATQRCRELLQPELLRQPVTHLVTVLSGSYTLLALALKVLRPAQTLVLSTRDASMLELQTLAGSWGGKVDLQLFKPTLVESLELDFSAKLAAFLDGDSAQGLVLDLTPGTKAMTIALDRIAPRGARLCYWDTEKQGAVPIPLTEQPRLFAARR